MPTPLPPAAPSSRYQWTVSAIIVGVLLFILLLIATVFAQIGLIRVPLLSAGYQPPAPTRVLPEQKPLTPDEFRALVASHLQTSIRQHPLPPYHLVLTEQELTAALRGSITQALRGPNVHPDHLQVLVLPDAFEFSGQFRVGWLHLDTVARLKPIVEKGAIRFETDGIRVDRLHIPDSLAMKLLGLAVARDVGVWQVSASGIAIRSVSLTTGSVDLELNKQ